MIDRIQQAVIERIFQDPVTAIAEFDGQGLSSIYSDLYRVARSLIEMGTYPTALSVYDNLSEKERESLEILGGYGYLSGIRGEVSDQEWQYALSSLEKRAKVQLFAVGAEKIGHFAALKGDVDKAEEALYELLAQIQSLKGKRDYLTPEELMLLGPEIIEKHYRNGGALSTMMDPLDQMLNSETGGGLSYGQLVTIGGYPSHGKSILTTAMAEGVAVKHDTFAFLGDGEMGLAEVAGREYQRVAGKSITSFRTLDEALGVVSRVMEFVPQRRLHAAHIKEPSLGKMLQKSRLAVSKGCRVLIWDGITRIASGTDREIRQGMIKVAQQAKAFGLEHNVLMFATSHLNRTNQNTPGLPKRPTRANFKEGDALIEESDLVLTVRRVDAMPCVEDIGDDRYGNDPEYIKTLKGLTRVELLKNRRGEWAGDVSCDLHFDGKRVSYQEEFHGKPFPDLRKPTRQGSLLEN